MRGPLLLLAPLLALGLSGCAGYTLVRRSDLDARPVQVVVDSSAIVSLRQQLTVLQSQCRADSIRYATSSSNGAGKNAYQDSIIRQRDAEIASLKEQLNKAQDELERIKRRLAIPTK